MPDLFEYRLELLKQEVDHLQTGIRGYDTILFTIKGWAITLFSGLVIFALDKNKPILFVFASITVVMFWILDSMNKSIQRLFVIRYRLIENFLRSSAFDQAVQERSFKDFSTPSMIPEFNTWDKRKILLTLREMVRFHQAWLYLCMLALLISLTFFQ